MNEILEAEAARIGTCFERDAIRALCVVNALP
jgi:hypothetical protein